MTDTSDILSRIVKQKHQDLIRRASTKSISVLSAEVVGLPATKGFGQALRDAVSLGNPAVIAEIKKASPSKGVIREDFQPAAIAESYAAHGASCLSVLTDVEFFQGSDAYLQQVRKAVELPIIRKDFMIDPYQVYEARVIGADCILLIAAILSDTSLQELASLAAELSLDVLVEVHTAEELERVLSLGVDIVGINNRNLKTFATSLNTTLDMLDDIPDDALVVTESGIHNRADVQLMREHGVNAFLVGEAFMRATDPGKELKAMFT